ncbi:MAG: hypothetical protein QOC59_677, partial [Microbacteriaceae bacterium]|nr:hypothetical protein [Microbacteriaceae bacterium]
TASAELLAHLTLRLQDSPVLVVASVRELDLGRGDAVTDAVAAITRRPGSRRLVLGGVPAGAATALVEAAVDRPVHPEVAAAIHRRGEGNPFCIGELSRLLAADGSLDEVRAVELAGVPAGVRDVVRGRLAGLSPSARSLLEVAAVIGREADLPILLAASGRPADECLDALEEALVSRVLEPVPEVPGRHRFAHALVAEAALAEVPSIRVARLHARVADAVRTAGGGWEVIAGHLWSAGPVVPPGPTADALERAADVAIRRAAYESADELLQRSLALRQTAQAAGLPGADEAELRTILAFATLRRELQGYGPAYSAIDADRAHRLSDRVGRLDLRMALLHLQWGAHATSGRVVEATRAAGVLRDLGAQADDEFLRMVGHHAWGVQCWHLGRLQEGAEHMQHVDRVMRSIGQDELERVETFDSGALFAAFAVHVLDLAGRLDDADERFAEVAARYRQPYELIVVTNFVGFSAVCAGEPHRVLSWLRRIPVRPDTQFGMFGATVQIFTGWATALLEDRESGLAELEQGMSRFLQLGARTGLGGMVSAHIHALLGAGRAAAEAAAVLRREADEAEASGEPLALPYLDLAAARIAAAADPKSPDTAQHLRKALTGGEGSGNVRLVSLVTRLAEEWGIALPADEDATAGSFSA